MAASVLSYTALAVVALLVLWRAPGTLLESPGLVCLALSSLLVCLIFFPQERFRIPIIDPVLAVIASGMAVWRKPAHD